MAPKAKKPPPPSKKDAELAEQASVLRVQCLIRCVQARKRVEVLRVKVAAAAAAKRDKEMADALAAAEAKKAAEMRSKNATTVGAALFLSPAQYKAACQKGDQAARTQRLIADPSLLETAAQHWRQAQIPGPPKVVRWQAPARKLPAASKQQAFNVQMSGAARVMNKQAAQRQLHPVPPQRPSTAPAKVRSSGGIPSRDKAYHQMTTAVEQTWRKQHKKLARPETAADRYKTGPGGNFGAKQAGSKQSPRFPAGENICRLPPNPMWVRHETITKFTPTRPPPTSMPAATTGTPIQPPFRSSKPPRPATGYADARKQKIGNVVAGGAAWGGPDRRNLVTAPGRLRGPQDAGHSLRHSRSDPFSPAMSVQQTMQRAMGMSRGRTTSN